MTLLRTSPCGWVGWLALTACGAQDTSYQDSPRTDAAVETTSPDAAVCPFEVDALLQEVGQTILDRRKCGNLNVIQIEQAQTSLHCMEEPAGFAAELTITRCIDCLIQSTYVVNAKGELFHVFRSDDALDSDDQRHVEVQRCSRLEHDPVEAVRCVDPQTLFTCTDVSPAAL